MTACRRRCLDGGWWIGQSDLWRLDGARSFSVAYFKRVVDAFKDQWFKQYASVDGGKGKVIASVTVGFGGWIVRGWLIMIAVMQRIS